MNVNKIQLELKKLNLAGWLLTDYQNTNIPAVRFLGINPEMTLSRRWFYWIPLSGEPLKLVHAVEPHVLDSLPGKKEMYAGRKQMVQKLSAIVPGTGETAIETSPECKLPSVSRVDAGMVELLGKIGFSVVSSADLLQRLTALWSAQQLADHKEAARILSHCMQDTFDFMKAHLDEHPTEYDVQQFILSRFEHYGAETSHPPICAFGVHTALPHHEVQRENSFLLERNMPVLVDMWARLKKAHSIYADITWMAYTGLSAPEDLVRVFDVVLQARDKALDTVRKAFEKQRPLTGADVDRACRKVISDHGFGDFFLHRTGHSLGEDVHGTGANLDSLESEDERHLIPETGFTIEPGIYLPGKFGVRSEINVVITHSGSVETTGKVQRCLEHLS